MKPIEIFNRGAEAFLKHKCLSCNFIKNNKVSKEDSFDEIISISNQDK
jgi:hypothetical protein